MYFKLYCLFLIGYVVRDLKLLNFYIQKFNAKFDLKFHFISYYKSVNFLDLEKKSQFHYLIFPWIVIVCILIYFCLFKCTKINIKCFHLSSVTLLVFYVWCCFLFPSESPNGFIPRLNISLVQNGVYRTIGQMMSTIIVQGGEPPAFLSPLVVDYILTGHMFDIRASPDDVADIELREALKKVSCFSFKISGAHVSFWNLF